MPQLLFDWKFSVNLNKVWDRLSNPRPRRAAGGYVLGHPERPDVSEEETDDSTIYPPSNTKMTSRYRFRDLLLGDFSFNDDGER